MSAEAKPRGNVVTRLAKRCAAGLANYSPFYMRVPFRALHSSARRFPTPARWMQVMAQGWVMSTLTDKAIMLGMVNFRLPDCRMIFSHHVRAVPRRTASTSASFLSGTQIVADRARDCDRRF
jgi:hypothetical protein